MVPQIDADKFKNDLLWAIGSPPLMRLQPPHRGLPAGIRHNVLHWLGQHEVRPPAPDHISPRLGLYFEYLWKYLFEHYPGFRLIAHNLPVQKRKQTLGAFDFIYYCKERRQHYHMETAVKFYLGVPDHQGSSSQLNRWLGPGGQDRLDLKFYKMLDSQSQLSLTPEGQATLANLGVTEVSAELTLKGRLFYHMGSNLEGPKGICRDHGKGRWLTPGDFSLLPEEGTWQLLDRHQWLTSDSQSNGAGVRTDELLTLVQKSFAHHAFPIMLKHTAFKSNPGLEADYYFVTPQDWAENQKLLDVADD